MIVLHQMYFVNNLIFYIQRSLIAIASKTWQVQQHFAVERHTWSNCLDEKANF